MRLFASRGSQKFGIQRFYLGILMRFAERQSAVLSVQPFDARSPASHGVWYGLPTASDTTPRASHDFDKVIARSPLSLFLSDAVQKLSRISKSVGYGNPDGRAADIDFCFFHASHAPQINKIDLFERSPSREFVRGT